MSMMSTSPPEHAAEPILSIRGVSKRFPGVLALDGVSLEIQRGELHAICGENGAGKSTLMKILAGVITADDGEILLRGEPVRFHGTRDAEHAGIGIVHQELQLVPELPVTANVFLGRERRTRLGFLDEASMEAATRERLDELDSGIDARAKLGTLRVGDQQLVEIAKSLVVEVEILILDEPTSALTESEVERLDRVIARLRQRGVTILYISHKLDEVFRLADRITVLRDGRLIETVRREETDPRSVARAMVGREIAGSPRGGHAASDEIVLRVDRLSLPWPGHARGWRLRDVSFSLHRGEVLGIAGLLGAGRTELLECLFGASEEAPEGEILLAGERVRFRHPCEALAAGVGLVSEDRKRHGIFPELSVRENISISALRLAARRGLVNARTEESLVETVARRLSVRGGGLETPIASLSGGNQQKALIARRLLDRPRVLLLDDPTRGVDVGAKAELYELIDALCADGLGVLLTSSELPELLALSHRILVLAEGRVTAEFARADATEARIMEAATGLHVSRDRGRDASGAPD